MARGIEILEGLKTTSMTSTFRAYLEHYRSHEWLEIIGYYTRPEIKHILSQPDPPSFEDLAIIPYEPSNDIGAYMRLIPGNTDNYIYVGAATSLLAHGGRKGLAQRINNHELPHHYTHPIKSIHYKTVESQGARDHCRWVNLFTIPVDENGDTTMGETKDLVALCYVAEAVVSDTSQITSSDIHI